MLLSGDEVKSRRLQFFLPSILKHLNFLSVLSLALHQSVKELLLTIGNIGILRFLSFSVFSDIEPLHQKSKLKLIQRRMRCSLLFHIFLYFFVFKNIDSHYMPVFLSFIFWLSRSEWKWLCDESTEPLLIFEYSQALLAILHKLWNSYNDILMKVTLGSLVMFLSKINYKMGSCWDFSCSSHWIWICFNFSGWPMLGRLFCLSTCLYHHRSSAHVSHGTIEIDLNWKQWINPD